MPNNREKSLCCGGGGGGAWNTVPVNEHFAVLRIQEAMGTGADVIVTTCPFCTRMLSEAVAWLGVDDQITVKDLAGLLFKSVSGTDELKPPVEGAMGMDQEVCHV